MAENRPLREADKMVGKHPLISNILIIIVVAVLGLVIAFLSLGLFTHHGQTDTVPLITGQSYSMAVERLHEAGFKVEIRDSLYVDGVKPGYVIEQFPAGGSVVKPGRKIYLYINAVHPKEVEMDHDKLPTLPALRGLSLPEAQSHLQSLGFKKIRVVYVLGMDDRVLRVTANGRTVLGREKVPVNADIVIVMSNGLSQTLSDSLFSAEQEADRLRQEAQLQWDSRGSEADSSSSSSYSPDYSEEDEYNSINE